MPGMLGHMHARIAGTPETHIPTAINMSIIVSGEVMEQLFTLFYRQVVDCGMGLVSVPWETEVLL